MANKSNKTRSKNFTTTEVSILVDEVTKKRDVLWGPLKGPKLTQFHRDRAWKSVVESVNAVAPVVRSLEEIRRKIRDLKFRTKQKADAFKRVAKEIDGDENDVPLLSELDRKVIAFIDTENVEEIQGGNDTSREQESLSSPSSPNVLSISALSPLPLPPISPVEEPTAKIKKKSSRALAAEHMLSTTLLQEEHTLAVQEQNALLWKQNLALRDQNDLLREMLSECRGFRKDIVREIRDFKEQMGDGTPLKGITAENGNKTHRHLENAESTNLTSYSKERPSRTARDSPCSNTPFCASLS
ncbi:hypothetical protein Zmor_014577 [Zophobas morio]|uniref:Regulatory protein zeste n=1 Tax=Zophobas morio TaxID=2755281 RepID=A0AA38MGJ9_9CUCU|nr:hypothetical protein Zmor_014577 [Zophobas morio]